MILIIVYAFDSFPHAVEKFLMQIIAHRGYWTTPAQKNTAEAFIHAFSNGLGTETDFRDAFGSNADNLVISHDPPQPGAFSVRKFLELYKEYDGSLPLAVNIKADGLVKLIPQLMKEFGVKKYFPFDMSVADMVTWHEAGAPYFIRHSEYEREPWVASPKLYAAATGVWLDPFHEDSLGAAAAQKHLENGKQVCFVSPELHKRDTVADVWSGLRGTKVAQSDKFYLCTDIPGAALDFFRDDLIPSQKSLKLSQKKLDPKAEFLYQPTVLVAK